MKIPMDIEIQIPSCPNFIRFTKPTLKGVDLMDVAELDVEQLRAIGAEWTDALVAHAAKRRSQIDESAKVAEGVLQVPKTQSAPAKEASPKS